MSYDPNAKIDRFIRESVLEEKNVDFTKLIEAKENIERLNHTFSGIEAEIRELEESSRSMTPAKTRRTGCLWMISKSYIKR